MKHLDELFNNMDSWRHLPAYQADYDIQIVYIQPNNPENRVNIFSFQEAAVIIRQHGDELSLRFAQSLLEWADIRAGGK
jgi:hypothetical protein